MRCAFEPFWRLGLEGVLNRVLYGIGVHEACLGSDLGWVTASEIRRLCVLTGVSVFVVMGRVWSF